MRSICSIVLLISGIFSFANEDKPNTLVWFDGNTFYQVLDKKGEATLFFREWNESVDHFLHEGTYNVTLQLDQSFDPTPSKKVLLPNLKQLSTIADKNTLNKYLEFLENYSRTIGYQHLVMPDPENLSGLEKEVVRMAIDKSPLYFLPNHYLSEELPESKNDIREDHPVIWIADQASNVRKLFKWNKKRSNTFLKKLEESRSTQFLQVRKIPEGLSKEIFKKGVVAIDPNNIFPLRNEGVIYLGGDEKFKEIIANYVTVFDKPQPEEYPVLLDKRGGSDLKIFGNEIIIDFLDSLSDPGNHSALLIPSAGITEDIVLAKMLFGAHPVSGVMEIKGNRQIPSLDFIGYAPPNYEGVNENTLTQIDSLASNAIKNFAIPGCQMSVVKNGSMVVEKSYGHFTYDSLWEVSNSTLFDLASVTKVMATLPAIALLVDQGRINLEDSIGYHLSEFVGSNKSQTTIKELLAHNGGIKSYIPFWSRAMDGDRLDVFYYKTKEDEEKDIRSYGFQPHPSLEDSLRSWIVRSDKIKNPGNYNYSDIGFMILHLLVERVSDMPFDEFLKVNFYEPMGLKTTFNPVVNGFDYKDIAPTEYDERYRNDQVWGEVHDRNAHVFGGVAGHAGLFSNASDLAIMMYMLLNDGYYGGRQYLTKRTLDTFNTRFFSSNRRGLGWDKKGDGKDAASFMASDESFGHTGFTGTMVWADPSNDLVFVFLSNRVYPDANNTKLMELNTRTEIHDVIYKSLSAN